MKSLTDEEKAELTIRIEKILGKPPHNMITEVIVKELVEKWEGLEKFIHELYQDPLNGNPEYSVLSLIIKKMGE